MITKLDTGARIILGLVFFVFGLNGFFHFLPQPPMPDRAASFIGALMSAGYLFPLLKAVEVVAGAMLLAGVFVPFALTLLAPIILNIAGFHLFVAPGGLGIVGLVLTAELFLACRHREAFAPLFARRKAAAVARESLQAAPMRA